MVRFTSTLALFFQLAKTSEVHLASWLEKKHEVVVLRLPGTPGKIGSQC